MGRRVAALGLIALIAAGCGSGAPRLSKQQYANRANAIACRFNLEVKAGLPRLRALRPPKSEQRMVSEWLAREEADLGRLKALQAALTRNDLAAMRRIERSMNANNARERKLIRSLGLRVCARPAQG